VVSYFVSEQPTVERSLVAGPPGDKYCCSAGPRLLEPAGSDPQVQGLQTLEAQVAG